MSSTLPKYVQAANQGSGESTGAGRSSIDTRQLCRDFLNQYKNLPDDFLKIPDSYYPASQQQQELSLLPQISDQLRAGPGGPLVDMIDISVVEAQLVKNYGLLRMDLYCKIRVGHYVAETATCTNGARNPKWDNSGVYQFALKPGIDSFHLEIYDENQFTSDEKIAWLHEPIPPEIFEGITVERWFPLSGRLGPQKEGSILLVMSHKRVTPRNSSFVRSMIQQNQDPMSVFIPSPIHQPHEPRIIGGPTVLPVDPNLNAYVTSEPIPNAGVLPQQAPIVGTNQGQQPQQRPREARNASEEDVNQLHEMFPSIEKGIIKSVLENHNLDKESAISALLAMG
jgi:toll-interacting protein